MRLRHSNRTTTGVLNSAWVVRPPSGTLSFVMSATCRRLLATTSRRCYSRTVDGSEYQRDCPEVPVRWSYSTTGTMVQPERASRPWLFLDACFAICTVTLGNYTLSSVATSRAERHCRSRTGNASYSHRFPAIARLSADGRTSRLVMESTVDRRRKASFISSSRLSLVVYRPTDRRRDDGDSEGVE